jgi:hypothetical protein
MRFPLWQLLVVAGALRAQQPLVEVFLPAAPGYELVYSFSQARQTVTTIYGDIGVRIAWRRKSSRPAGCTKTPLHSNVVVSFESGSRKYKDLVFGYAKPYAGAGACVTLLTDRLREAVKTNPTSAGFLLGHVLAHEIGHVLEGSSRHSETGVMKARWSLHETVNMRAHLSFTPEDAEYIRGGLAAPPSIDQERVPNHASRMDRTRGSEPAPSADMTSRFAGAGTANMAEVRTGGVERGRQR